MFFEVILFVSKTENFRGKKYLIHYFFHFSLQSTIRWVHVLCQLFECHEINEKVMFVHKKIFFMWKNGLLKAWHKMVFLKALYQILERLLNCMFGKQVEFLYFKICIKRNILHLVENTSAIFNNHKSTKNFKIYIKKIIFSQGGKKTDLYSYYEGLNSLFLGPKYVKDFKVV